MFFVLYEKGDEELMGVRVWRGGIVVRLKLLDVWGRGVRRGWGGRRRTRSLEAPRRCVPPLVYRRDLLHSRLVRWVMKTHVDVSV